MLHPTQNIHGTGNIVVLYSGLYVLQPLVDINKKGVYGAALSKKRRYYMCYINYKNIKAPFADKDVVAMDALCGKLDNVPLHIFDMK